jgi:hypothetical protein
MNMIKIISWMINFIVYVTGSILVRLNNNNMLYKPIEYIGSRLLMLLIDIAEYMEFKC